MNNRRRYIAIEGNIGVGKTTLTQSLCKIFKGSILLEEFKDNKFLKEFYASGSYAFEMEMQFLLDRSIQINKFFSKDYAKIFSDFHIDKSLIFSKMNLNNTCLEIINQTHFNLFNHFPKPDLIIYLDGSLDSIMSNISKRNRAYEQKFSLEYLEKLSLNYNHWLESLEIPVFKINSNKLLFKGFDELKNIFSPILNA